MDMKGFGEAPKASEPDQFKQEAAASYSETVEKMDDIVFEKEVQELEAFSEQVEKDIFELEAEIEEFCADEAAETEVEK